MFNYHRLKIMTNEEYVI